MIASFALAVALPPAWVHWPSFRDIAANGSAATLRSVVAPPALFTRAQPDLHDVRIITSDGREVAYMVVIPVTASQTTTQEAALSDAGFVPGSYSQVVADLGALPEIYDTIDILTPRNDFTAHANVEASDDRQTWRIIRSGTTLFDYQSEGLASNLRVTFPPSHARYLRIRVLDPSRNFPITGVRIVRGIQKPPPLVRYETGAASVSMARNAQVLTIDTGIANLPVSSVRVDSTTPTFSRSVTIESSRDGHAYDFAGGGVVRRLPNRQPAITITLPDETDARYWRITIQNGNDPPLQSVRAELYGIPRKVVFAPQSGALLLFLYGNARADAPKYDFAGTHPASEIAQAKPVSLGPEKENAAFTPDVSGIPWSERNPWIAYGALAVVIAALAIFALRTIASARER